VHHLGARVLVLALFYVMVVNRLLWRPLYRLSGTKYAL
jgi:hypothetical protein